MSAPRVWINAGEPSGDFHGALLAKALHQLAPGCRITGMGGSELLAAGQDPAAHIRDLSVMGFTEVLGQLPRILRLLRRIKHELYARRPDVLVCIDAPDFNFRVIAMARKLGIPVAYYISPKLWAWRQGRVRFIKKHVNRMLCIFPFETAFYLRHGIQADYVGNPLLDAIPWRELRQTPPDPQQIGILPGSRRKELRALLPEFARAARLLLARRPGLRFSLGCAPNVAPEELRALWPADLPLELVPPEQRHVMMRRSILCLAASGTVTLETALLGTPTLVAYRLSPLTFALARRVVRVPFISLPNLILSEEVFPEHLQEQASGEVLATRAAQWLDKPELMADIQRRLERLPALLGGGGATLRAARAVLELCPRPLPDLAAGP